MLCPIISGLDAITVSSRDGDASKSEIRSSIVACGLLCLIASTVAAQWAAPWSGRSSRVTDVTTTCRRFISATLCATFCGSSPSGGNGCPVLVAQKRQLRVQISPKIIKVAVLLLQHSALFGHRPLLQIVCNPCSATIRSTSAKASLLWSRIFSQEGLRVAQPLSYNFGILSSLFSQLAQRYEKNHTKRKKITSFFNSAIFAKVRILFCIVNFCSKRGVQKVLFVV